MTENTTTTGRAGSINLMTDASKIVRTISRLRTTRLIIGRSMTPISVELGEVAVEASEPKAVRGTGELKSSHQATMDTPTQTTTVKMTPDQLGLSPMKRRTGTPTIDKVHQLLKKVAVDVEVDEASPWVVLEAGSKMTAAPTSPIRGLMGPTMAPASLDSRNRASRGMIKARGGMIIQLPTWVGARVAQIEASKTKERASVAEVSAKVDPSISNSRLYPARMVTSSAVLTKILTLIRATLANTSTVLAKRLPTSKSSA